MHGPVIRLLKPRQIKNQNESLSFYKTVLACFE